MHAVTKAVNIFGGGSGDNQGSYNISMNDESKPGLLCPHPTNIIFIACIEPKLKSYKYKKALATVTSI